MATKRKITRRKRKNLIDLIMSYGVLKGAWAADLLKKLIKRLKLWLVLALLCGSARAGVINLPAVVTSTNTNCVTVYFDPVPGAWGYKVQWNDTNEITVSNLCWINICGQNLGANYTVIAFNGFGVSDGVSGLMTNKFHPPLSPPVSNVLVMTTVLATNNSLNGKWQDAVKYPPVTLTNPAGNLVARPYSKIDFVSTQQPSKTVILP
jgi:hypothetical protein